MLIFLAVQAIVYFGVVFLIELNVFSKILYACSGRPSTDQKVVNLQVNNFIRYRNILIACSSYSCLVSVNRVITCDGNLFIIIIIKWMYFLCAQGSLSLSHRSVIQAYLSYAFSSFNPRIFIPSLALVLCLSVSTIFTFHYFHFYHPPMREDLHSPSPINSAR